MPASPRDGDGAALADLVGLGPVPWVITRASKWGSGHACRGSISWLVCKVEREIGLAEQASSGQLHRLRHTYVTRLSAVNTPPRVIMELAGPRDLATSLRYMHVIPGATTTAIASLESFDRGTAERLRQHGGSTKGAKSETGV